MKFLILNLVLSTQVLAQSSYSSANQDSRPGDTEFESSKDLNSGYVKDDDEKEMKKFEAFDTDARDDERPLKKKSEKNLIKN
jgi:hypothetical protein